MIRQDILIIFTELKKLKTLTNGERILQLLVGEIGNGLPLSRE